MTCRQNLFSGNGQSECSRGKCQRSSEPVDIEVTNITVMRKEMLRGSAEYYKHASFEPGGEDSYNLPNLIHFIWIKNPIREEYIQNIRAFTKNKDYKVRINFYKSCEQVNKF